MESADIGRAMPVPAPSWSTPVLARHAMTALASMPLLAGSARAQAVVVPKTEPPPGVQGHRALATGFEPDPALPSELPQGFYRLLTRDSQREGWPPFGRVRASDTQCADGGWSLAFELAGGSMAVVTEPALIPAAAGEIFEARVLVLGQGLERARPRLVVRALDARRAPIDGAEWVATSENGRGWGLVFLRSGAMPAGTRSLEVALEVRPIDARDPTGDVTGTVGFDSLEVWRIPRVVVECDRAGAPIGAAPQRLLVRVDDPLDTAGPHESLNAGDPRDPRNGLDRSRTATTRGRLLDADGVEVLSWAPTHEREFSIDLPPLPPGSFEVAVSVEAEGRELDRVSRSIAIGTAPPRRAEVAEELVRFGLWIERPSMRARDQLLQTMRLVRPSFVIIDLGDPSPSAEGCMSLSQMRRFVDDLRLEGIEPIIRLAHLPAALAARLHLEPNDAASIFERTDDAWREAFGPWFEHIGHVASRWMIESGGPSASSGASAESIERVIAAEALVPGFVNVAPLVEVVDATADGSRAVADAAARQAIDQWRGGARMIALRGAIAEEPGAAALAFGALASASAGARSSADLEAGSDLGCLLLSCEGSARVLVWRRDRGTARTITLPFDGETMTAQDALGAPIVLDRRQGAVAVEIGSSPIVIDGVDATLGAFLATLRFEDPGLDGSTAEQPLSLRLTNPWDVTMEGTLRFVAPVEWTFVPRMKRFSLPPGGTASMTVQATLPRTQPTGATRIGVELEFTADRGYALRIDPEINIEVRDFACDASMRPLQLTDGRSGAIVELLLSNRSTRPLELESTIATTSGLAKRDGPIRIEPGAKARRMIRLDEPPGGTVVVTISQTNGPLRLVRTLPESGSPSARTSSGER